MAVIPEISHQRVSAARGTEPQLNTEAWIDCHPAKARVHGFRTAALIAAAFPG